MACCRLEAHPRVRRVHYPGLRSHPDYHIAHQQMRGFGGVVSFEVDGDLWTTARVTAYSELLPRDDAGSQALYGAPWLRVQAARVSSCLLQAQQHTHAQQTRWKAAA